GGRGAPPRDVGRRARVHAGPAQRPGVTRGPRARANHRRGARLELVRLGEPDTRVDGRPRSGPMGLATVRLPRLPGAAGARPRPARAAPARGALLQPADVGVEAGLAPLDRVSSAGTQTLYRGS